MSKWAKLGSTELQTVILHQFPREITNRKVPSSSPACYKLETYLRMAKIPFKNILGTEMSSKGKCPWIEYNGEQVADSNFCVWFLNEKFGVDLDEHLSPAERGVAHAFKTMLEENTLWTLSYNRFVDNYDETSENLGRAMPWYLRSVVPRILKNRIISQMNGHGIGRHTRDEIYGIAKRDLKSISDFLGDKKFLMGDKPSLVDCSVFALVTIFVWQWSSSPQAVYIKNELGNLEPYCQRMKEHCYPDWEEVMKE